MKPFFITLLVISIVFPFYSFIDSMRVFAHNQWKSRHERLSETAAPNLPSPHLGLTAGNLASASEFVANGYRDSVYDGYRLGAGYEALWFQSMGLDFFLFVASLIGLGACRSSSRLTRR